ncbi:MAG: OadG family protein [Anaerolineaceae bacterium]
MEENLMSSGLLITAIGMGLVFVVILFLWGMMDLMVKITADRKPADKPVAPSPEDERLEAPPTDRLLKQRAAAAAVATLLSLQASVSQSAPYEPGETSPWQAINRTSQFNQRSSMYHRKNRGSKE